MDLSLRDGGGDPELLDLSPGRMGDRTAPRDRPVTSPHHGDQFTAGRRTHESAGADEAAEPEEYLDGSFRRFRRRGRLWPGGRR